MTPKIGDWVRIERDDPAKGTWSRYEGRTGLIVTKGQASQEWGVVFAEAAHGHPVYFLASEMTPRDRPKNSEKLRAAYQGVRDRLFADSSRLWRNSA